MTFPRVSRRGLHFANVGYVIIYPDLVVARTGVRNSELVISHIILRDCRLHIFPTTFLEIAVYLTDTQQVLPGGSANVIKRNWIDATTVNRLNPHEHTSRLNCKYSMLRVLRF